MEKLTLDDNGVWKVTTKASHYIIDIRPESQPMAIRRPGQGIDEGGDYRVNDLLGDEEWYAVWSLSCDLGASMYMDCFGAYNWRVSTPVVSIERLPDDQGYPGHTPIYKVESE